MPADKLKRETPPAINKNQSKFLESFIIMGDLSEKLIDDIPMNIREPKIPTSMSKRQLFVIKSQQVQNGRVKIMDMNFIPDRLEAKFIGLTMNIAPLHTPSRHPR